MPFMDGLEMITCLRNKEELCPVIFITAENVIIKDFYHPCEIIKKPPNMVELLKKIKKFLA
jgi:DNA-binding response OmpR family regulator